MGKIANEVIEKYYNNNGRELKRLVSGILKKNNLEYILKNQIELEEIFSLCNVAFVECIPSFNEEKCSFDKYLWMVLTNKIKTELTKQNRYKRKTNKNIVSLETPIQVNGKEKELTIQDTLRDKKTTEEVVFENELSEEMLKYLSSLSDIERSVINMRADGYSPKEIINGLNITERKYFYHVHMIRNKYQKFIKSV